MDASLTTLDLGRRAMTASPIARSFVYALLDPARAAFYIGIGSRNDRPKCHEAEARAGGTSAKCQAIRKILATGVLEITVAILVDKLPRTATAQIECDLIQLLGRAPYGPLTNLTSGGEGLQDISEQTREKMRTNARNPQIAAKRLAAFRETLSQTDLRARLSRKLKAAWQTTETREKQSRSQKIRNSRPEESARRSAANRKRWAVPENRSRQSAALTAANQRAEVIQNRSCAAIAAWENAETRAIRLAKLRAAPRGPNKGRNLPKGVHAHGDRFRAVITIDGRTVALGVFSTAHEASEAFQTAFDAKPVRR